MGTCHAGTARGCFIKQAGVAVDGPKPFLFWVRVTSQFAGQQHTSEIENFGLLQADIIHWFLKKISLKVCRWHGVSNDKHNYGND